MDRGRSPEAETEALVELDDDWQPEGWFWGFPKVGCGCVTVAVLLSFGGWLVGDLIAFRRLAGPFGLQEVEIGLVVLARRDGLLVSSAMPDGGHPIVRRVAWTSDHVYAETLSGWLTADVDADEVSGPMLARPAGSLGLELQSALDAARGV